MRIATLLLLGAAALAFGCPGGSDTHVCTDELRSAVVVRVSSPGGLPIDSVIAARRTASECSNFTAPPPPDAQAASAAGGGAAPVEEFTCFEQGGGEYIVRVRSGEQTWTQSVDVKANACHVTEAATLDFVLDPDTAD